MKKIVFLLSMLVFLSTTSILYAQDGTIRSNQYRIKTGNINFGSGTPSSSSYNLGTTVGQIAANEFSSTGYTVKAGFQYIHSIIPFTFSISDTSIELGSLTPQTPSTATTNLGVSFGGSGQYQVTAVELGPLSTFSGSETIPDTSCNGGAETCTESAADVWNSASAYGFGYNVSGDGKPSDFVDSTYFRPFPDSDSAESPEVVMSSTNVTTSQTSTVTFKANVSNIQEAGTYQTIIKFVATPSF